LPAVCFSPSLSDSFIFLTLTLLVVVLKFINFRFALFTPLWATFKNPEYGVYFRKSYPTKEKSLKDMLA
jgi:hypothetical protein